MLTSTQRLSLAVAAITVLASSAVLGQTDEKATLLTTTQRPAIVTSQGTSPAVGVGATPSAPRSAAQPGPRNDFQEFVERSVGSSLPLFGYNLFDGATSTFAPLDRVPVPAEYVIGPGDEILLRGWGQIDIDAKLIVDRNGTVQLPKVGPVRVVGLKYKELTDALTAAVSRIYRNFELNATLGQLRSVQVFVVGHAVRPGNYTVSSLSTLINTIFASGGPSNSGSLRRIQLRRDDRVVSEIDLYDLILRGDKSKDVPLLPGDVIYFPPAGALVAVSGSVKHAAIYELRGDASIKDLLEWAGGLATTASSQRVSMERIENRRTRKVEEFALDQAGLDRKLGDGDLLRVAPLSPRFDNAVTLRGNVDWPMRFPWKEGLRVRDLIPGPETLVRRDYWLKGNAKVGVASSTASTMRTELLNSLPDVNWDYAVIERLNWDNLTTTLISFDLGGAVLRNDPAQNLLLRPGDVLTVFSADDIKVPVAKRNHYVRLEGEVARPGVYKIESGETVRQLVARVGGLTSDAYLYGAEFTRESTRALQQKQLEDAVDRVERESMRVASERLQRAVTPADVDSVNSQKIVQQLAIERMRSVKATGRIVLELAPHSTVKDIPDMVLQDADRLFVPTMPSTVSVYGAVYNQNSFIYIEDKRAEDYLSQAGGPTETANDSSMYVLHADGSVSTGSASIGRLKNWFGSFGGDRVLPGDALIVPEKFDTASFTKDLMSWSQIFYQFALGVAGVKILKQ